MNGEELGFIRDKCCASCTKVEIKGICDDLQLKTCSVIHGLDLNASRLINVKNESIIYDETAIDQKGEWYGKRSY
jgi:hypothetical protein